MVIFFSTLDKCDIAQVGHDFSSSFFPVHLTYDQSFPQFVCTQPIISESVVVLTQTNLIIQCVEDV
jgi:hypothetical protein